MRSVPGEGLLVFVCCLQERSLILFQHFPPHTLWLLSHMCALHTVALHMHSLVRIVCLFYCTIALGFGSRTKGFILVVQIYFTRSFISNSLSRSQGKTWWHVLDFQSPFKYPVSGLGLCTTRPIILQFRLPVKMAFCSQWTCLFIYLFIPPCSCIPFYKWNRFRGKEVHSHFFPSVKEIRTWQNIFHGNEFEVSKKGLGGGKLFYIMFKVQAQQAFFVWGSFI